MLPLTTTKKIKKMKITKNLLHWSRICWWAYNAVIAQNVHTTSYSRQIKRIAAWNDEDLDNIPFTNQDWIKLLGSRGRNLFFSTDVEKQLTSSGYFYLG
jgi:hypothetical protein